jgi:beta-galactosidase
MPQAHGHHTEARRLELSTLAECQSHFFAHKLRIETMSGSLGFNATNQGAEDLCPAKHNTDLVNRPETIRYLNAAHRDLDTQSCGPGC